MSKIPVCREWSEYLVICKPIFFDNHPMCGDAIKIYCAVFLCNVFVYWHCLYLCYICACRHEHVLKKCDKNLQQCVYVLHIAMSASVWNI